ncbi:AzlC family ABC transporter permease [Campylobacter sp. RM9328]|uniref:AzlC family ABC transporter permease n=1 Tax=Campylobacter sp. RM9328 TaxID=1705720 RepID=UPI001472EF70|nr:AzlC family ABC transporter permease [Campylobacter sp. RM9328]
MGYFPLGIAFGIVAHSVGISPFIALMLSMLSYGGAAQFMMLSLFAAKTTFLEVFVVSYLVNLRHTFYGLSLLKEYNGLKFKIFNIATLTDETFAIFKTLHIENLDDRGRVFTALNFLSWSYWALGTATGSFAGMLIKFDMSGLEFSLTALFIVIVIEMFKTDRNFKVLGAACIFGILGLALLPVKFLLVGSMLACFVFILIFKDRL